LLSLAGLAAGLSDWRFGVTRRIRPGRPTVLVADHCHDPELGDAAEPVCPLIRTTGPVADVLRERLFGAVWPYEA
jgi:hypothetical protein